MTSENNLTSSDKGFNSFIAKYKLYIILALVISLLIGVVVGFYLLFLSKNVNSSESKIVPETTPITRPSTGAPTEHPTPENKEAALVKEDNVANKIIPASSEIEMKSLNGINNVNIDMVRNAVIEAQKETSLHDAITAAVKVEAARLVAADLFKKEMSKQDGYVDKVEKRKNRLHKIVVTSETDAFMCRQALEAAKIKKKGLESAGGNDKDMVNSISKEIEDAEESLAGAEKAVYDAEYSFRGTENDLEVCVLSVNAGKAKLNAEYEKAAAMLTAAVVVGDETVRLAVSKVSAAHVAKTNGD